MYVENLAVMGYGLSIYMADALFRHWNDRSADHTVPLLLLLDVPPTTIEGTWTLRVWCSLCSAALCLVPLPLSGPRAFINVMIMIL